MTESAHMIVSQGGKDKRYDLVEQFVFVGRAADCGVRVQSEVARDRECQILHVDGKYRLVHLGGGPGTFLNGEAVQQAELRDGDLISIGDTVITFKGGMSAASAAALRARTRREGQVNRRERPKGGLTKLQTAIICMTGTALVVILVWQIYLSRGAADSATRAYEKGQKAQIDQHWDDALAAYRTIPEGAPNYDEARARIKEIDDRRKITTEQTVEADTHREFTNNIDAYISRWLSTGDPKEKPDPAAVRYFVKRCETFMKEHPTHPDSQQVQDLLVKWKPLVAAGDPNWHDIEFEATREKERDRYGDGVKVLDAWVAAHPDDKASRTAANALRTQIVDYAGTQWDHFKTRAAPSIRDGNLGQALGLYEQALKRFDGIPDLHQKAQQAIDDLKKGVRVVGG